MIKDKIWQRKLQGKSLIMQNKMKDIQRKKILNKTQVEYGNYVINHVFGCSHGCRFPCYAFNIARRFGKVESYKEWCEPRLVSNTMDLLNKELPKIKDRIHSVQLCFTTDPFMDDYPEVGKLSLEIINRINQEKIKCIILTKGTLPSYLLKTSKINEYGITLVSLHNKFKDEYEPNSTCYQKRIDALKICIIMALRHG